MNTIFFSDMYSLDYHLTHLFTMNQKWTEGQEFSRLIRPRQTSALVYYRNCEASFTLPDGDVLPVKKGDLVYIPQGAHYITYYHPVGKEPIHTQLLEFELMHEEKGNFVAADKITLLRLPQSFDLRGFYDEIVSLYNKPLFSHGLLRARVYALLHEICQTFHYDRIYSKKYMPIANGIAYLEHNHSYELSIAEIAKLCHVSETCFRQLFEEYSGLSPVRYRTQNLLRQSINLLENGNLTIGETALYLGFKDISYLSRWFKKHTGTSPSSYVNTLAKTD